MTIHHSIAINALPEAVFSLYNDSMLWPEWDKETLEVGLTELRIGATGWLKPRTGPKVKIRVIEMKENASFTVEGCLPLCRIEFGHQLEVSGEMTTATHWV